MSDAGAAGAAGGEGAGAGAAAAGAAGGAPAEWLGGLPEDLRGDATLSRYADVPSLARAHVEAHKVAKSKFTIPGADATPEQWGQVFDALGRPSDPTGYEIPLPEGQEASPLAEAFRPIAHQLGLNGQQAKGLAEFFNGQMQAVEQSFYQQGDQEIAALRQELGAEYEPKVAAAKEAFKKLGFSPQVADELDRKVGSAALVRAFIDIAPKLGEHGRVDGGGQEHFGADVANAEQQLGKLYQDSSWREKLNAGDATVVAQHERLRNAARAQAGGR